MHLLLRCRYSRLEQSPKRERAPSLLILNEQLLMFVAMISFGVPAAHGEGSRHCDCPSMEQTFDTRSIA